MFNPRHILIDVQYASTLLADIGLQAECLWRLKYTMSPYDMVDAELRVPAFIRVRLRLEPLLVAENVVCYSTAQPPNLEL